jgi:Ca2+-binding EF-hand superfamily protein
MKELEEDFDAETLDGMMKLAQNDQGVVTKESFVTFMRAAGL